MASLKIKIMAADVIANNKDWQLFSKSMLRCYMKNKYNISVYMANMVIKEMYDSKEKDM